MQTTTNFNLKKPEGTDIYNIQNENDNMDIIDVALAKAHSTDDSASTDLVDGDYIPFYDVSATAKKKALWSTIIAKLKNIFPMGSTLAPIANGPKYPGTWSAGKQFVYQGLLYKTKVNVTSSDNINVGTGGNAELASDITSQISNLDSKDASIINCLKNYTVDFTNNAITLNPTTLRYNSVAFMMRSVISLAASTYTCNIPYDGYYYIPLAYLSLADAKKVFPGCESVSVGNAIMAFELLDQNHNQYSMVFLKYSANTIYLIAAHASLRSSTMGGSVSLSSAIKLNSCVTILKRDDWQGFPS